MELLKNFNLRDLSHDLIIDGSESFYEKIPDEYSSPIIVEYPYPIEVPLKTIGNCNSKLALRNSKRAEKKMFIKREFERTKNYILNQDMRKYAILPKYLVDSIQHKIEDPIDYGFDVSCSYGVLEKFYNDGELCLIRPKLDNNLQISQPRQPGEKVVLQWSCPDPIKSIRNMNYKHSNSFILRGKNNLYVIEIDNDFHIKIDLKLKCDVGYLAETLNHINGLELALMDTKTKLKLFDLREHKVISTYTMEELYFGYQPRILKMNYLTENMLMIMTEKHIKVLDNRCKNAPQEIDINLENCDILLDFCRDKNGHHISNEVYFSSKHSYFIYDMRTTCVKDYIHHNLTFPPCFINCHQDHDSKLVTLFGQSPREAALFGTASPYSLPYHLFTLVETLVQSKTRGSAPAVPNIMERLDFPITGVQLVPNNGEVVIYFSNIFGELFRQDILLKRNRSEEPFMKMLEWLIQINETNESGLNITHFCGARKVFNSDIDFNDVDIFNYYEKTRIHDFLEDEEFDFNNWNVENFDEIWNDENCLEDLKFLELNSSPSEKSKVEDWISSTNFSDRNIHR